MAEPGRVCSGYVLVGGRSSRMGRDKVLLEFGSRPLGAWMADMVKKVCGNVTLVGGIAKYSGLGFPVIEDVFYKQGEGQGPLGGIHAALLNSQQNAKPDSDSPLSLIVGCDMPYLTAEFLEFLLKTARTAGADAVVPESEAFGLEPLCAVYAPACLPAIETALRNGERKISRALDGLRLRRMAGAEWRPYDPNGRLFSNLNTFEDYEEARRNLATPHRGVPA